MTRRGFSSRLAAVSAGDRTGCTEAVSQDSILAETTGIHPNTSGDSCLEEDIKPDSSEQDSLAQVGDWESRWRACGPKVLEPAITRPPHLDSLSPELEKLLEKERCRLEASVQSQLRQYDELKSFRNAQDMLHNSRDDFEQEVRGEASKEMHDIITDAICKLDTLKSRRCHLRGPDDDTAEEASRVRKESRIVIIALMAVHITTQGRLEKLSNTLQSIQSQDLSGVNAELHIAVSWFSPEPALAARVQEAFHNFIAARERDAPRIGCMPTVARSSRISSSKFSAVLEATQKHASRSETCSGRLSPSASEGSATVTIRQTERYTQFQHYRAALRAAETELRRRWGLRSDESARRSVWVIFGDDDDLWHRRRTAEFALAVQSHQAIDSVAVMATLTRAGPGLFEGQDHVPERVLPKIADQVDSFLRPDAYKTYVGSDHANDEKCREWQTSLEKDDCASTDRQPPEDLHMEHFDFSPRLRVLHEYFDTTAEDIIAHRFCDLRLCEFLGTYPRFGREFGLRLHFFKPQNCWMYFYRNAGVAPETMKDGIGLFNGQEANDLPDVMFSEVEHVSAEVPITDTEIALGEKLCPKFWIHDLQMTPKRLTKYFANFRASLEHHILRLHTRVVDQRRFDGLVFICAASTFGTFAELCTEQGGPSLSSSAGQMLLCACHDFAKSIADALGITVFWRDTNSVLTPECRIEILDSTPTVSRDSTPASSKGRGKGLLSKGKGKLNYTFHGTSDRIPLPDPDEIIDATYQIKFFIPGATLG